MSYFIKRGEVTYGPYSLADLQNYVQSGNIAPSDLAQTEGTDNWVPVSMVIGNIPVGAPPIPPNPGNVGYGQPASYQPPYPGNVGYAPPYGNNLACNPAAKSRVAFVLLGVFLGALGIHNFYAGYTGKAVAQLLITVLTFGFAGFISWIWAVIEVCTITVDSKGVSFSN